MRNNKLIFIFCIIVTVCIISLGIFTQHILQKDTDSLNKTLSIVKASMLHNDLINAKKYSEKLSSSWLNIENKWALVINHHEIDNITSSLVKAVEYVKFGDKENALVYLKELEKYFSHIPEMEKLYLKNIL